MARVIKFDDEGNIIVPTPKLGERAAVRFPSEEEQAQGMTEVPRATRLKESSGN